MSNLGTCRWKEGTGRRNSYRCSSSKRCCRSSPTGPFYSQLPMFVIRYIWILTHAFIDSNRCKGPWQKCGRYNRCPPTKWCCKFKNLSTSCYGQFLLCLLPLGTDIPSNRHQPVQRAVARMQALRLVSSHQMVL